MFVLKCFYFVVIIISVKAKSDTVTLPNAKEKCDNWSGKTQNVNELLSKVDKWWNEEMSIKKPLKCKDTLAEQTIPEDILSILNPKTPILSYPCLKLKDENSIKFHFHGKIIDGLLTGPGKLTLSGPGLTSSKDACLKVSYIMVRNKVSS
jgi:hypothetical protein